MPKFAGANPTTGDLERITNMRRLLKKLKDRQLASKMLHTGTINVGYNCEYAKWVHEKVEMKLAGLPRSSGHGRYWDPQGKAEAKFLERAYREMMNNGMLHERLLSVYHNTHSLRRALMAAGRLIRIEAQRRTPVDTGRLKNSAYVELV